MNLSALGREMYDEIAEMTIVDAHEHLPSEAAYLFFKYSGLNMFAGGYIWHDLESAGLPSVFKDRMRDGGDQPVEDWWPEIRPYWEQVKYGSYARALRIAAHDLFGISDINDQTIGVLAEKVKADNRPGLYGRILQDRCRIRYSLTCVDQPDFPDDPGLRGVTKLMKVGGGGAGFVRSLAERSGVEVRSLEDAAEAAQGLLRDDLAKGAVGFKATVGSYEAPRPKAAEREFKLAARASGAGGHFPALRDYLFDKCLDVAEEADVPVAVHTGYWGDFRELDVKHMFSFAMRRRGVRFDMFHLGMPMLREAALMGKTLPNVTLNLTWCPIISQLQTARTLAEIIDLVPMNKVIAFGGDYRAAVQKVYGHLVLCRQVVASVLANRVKAGELDKQTALEIAKLWLRDNPSRIYKLGEGKPS